MQIDFSTDINKSNYFNLNYRKIDDLMIKIIWFQFLLITFWVWMVEALQPSVKHPGPFSWRIVGPHEAIIVTIIGLIAALIPTLLNSKLKNHYQYRILVILVMFIQSYLLIFFTGGSIEAHFLILVILLLINMYYDWRLVWIGVFLTGIHHGILNFIQPNWVFFYEQNNSAVFAHVLYVVFLAVFATWVCENGRKSVEAAAKVNKDLENQLRSKITGAGK